MTATIVRIALSVFRESVRDKVLYNLVAFAILLMGASVLIGQLTAGQDVKIIKDLGLAATSIFGTFIAIFIGIGLVSKEVERRSIYALLAKPMTRTEFVLGKFAGLALTLFVNLACMALALYGVLALMWAGSGMPLRESWDTPALDPRLLIAIGMIYLQLLVITAIAILFSTYSSALLSAAFTFGLTIAGHFSTDLRNFDQVSEAPAVIALTRALYYVLPNLSTFDMKSRVVHGVAIPGSEIALAALYAATYIALVLTAAVWIFSRRDFK